MELNEFTRKYIPNYKDIEKELFIVNKEAYNLVNSPYSDIDRNSTRYDLLKVLFPKALQTFIDVVCEKQIEKCKMSLNNNGYESESILNTEHVNLEEL